MSNIEQEVQALVRKDEKAIHSMVDKLLKRDKEGFASRLTGWLVTLGTGSTLLGFLADRAVARAIAHVNANYRILAAMVAEMEEEERQQAVLARFSDTVSALLTAVTAELRSDMDDNFVKTVLTFDHLTEVQTAELKDAIREVVKLVQAQRGNTYIHQQGQGNIGTANIVHQHFNAPKE